MVLIGLLGEEKEEKNLRWLKIVYSIINSRQMVILMHGMGYIQSLMHNGTAYYTTQFQCFWYDKINT